MEYLTEQLTKQYFEEKIFGKNYSNAHQGLYISDDVLHINCRDEMFDKVIPVIKRFNWEKFERPVKRFGKRIPYEKRWEVPLPEINECRLNDSFAFEGIIITCSKDDDGFYYVPSFLKDSFRKHFPTVKNREENCNIEFVEHTGSYPAWCSGKTILRAGQTKICTTIIGHRTKIPEVLNDVKEDLLSIPEIARDNRGYCCGGCE